MLGFDACLDHRAPDLGLRLTAACPDGIDVYFENVGGDVLDSVMTLLDLHARIPVCGVIAHYNQKGVEAGEDKRPKLLATVLQKRVRMQGFIILDHYADRFAAFRFEMSQWIADGRVVPVEDAVDGLEHAPAALIGLLQGSHLGKLIVSVSPSEAAA